MSKHDLNTPQVTLTYPVEFEVANLNLAQIVAYTTVNNIVSICAATRFAALMKGEMIKILLVHKI
jgi:hypothetical protein